ncbi:MAG: putative nitroreductase YfkO [Planctomycetota bacterium]|jgi:nitroreductase
MSGNLIDALQWRYATKQFNPQASITPEDWATLERVLLLAPSSYGLQPWKFFVVTSPALKAQLPAVAWGQPQPRDCSHFVVFAARLTVDDAWVTKMIQHMAAVRGLRTAALDGLKDAILSKTHRMGSSHLNWTSRQCYIALGMLLQAAALLRIDACPMEGIIPDQLDPLLGLTDSGYTSVVACALGYRSDSDPLANQAKVRFDASDMIVHL